MTTKSSHLRSDGIVGRRIQNSLSSSRVASFPATSNILMCLTMRVLVLLALCLCFSAPSPVLSITLPEGEFPAKTQMAGVGDEATEEEKFNAIAKNLIRTVFDVADQQEQIAEDDVGKEEGDISYSKRARSSKREREPRWSYPLGRRGAAGEQMGSRSNSPIMASRAKFTFGKRAPEMDSMPTSKQLLLEELEKEAYLRNQDLAFLDDADLYNIEPEDEHQVQKDAFSAFTFGKRGRSAFAFGKRGMPSFAFGRKRGLSSFAFGKRGGYRGPAFAFGRREWTPAEQELDAPEQLGPYEIKRNVAFAFGKRENQ